MSLGQRKTQEYKAILRSKTDEELKSMCETLRNKAKEEKKREAPDRALLENLRWQHQLCANEINRRNPPQQHDKIEGDLQETVHPKSFAETLKDKSLDELKKLSASIKAQFDKLASLRLSAPDPQVEAQKQALQSQLDSTNLEMSSRSPDASSQAKADMQVAENKIFGIDKGVLISGLIGTGAGLVAAKLLKKSYLGFGLMGLAGGLAVNYFFIAPASVAKSTPKTTTQPDSTVNPKVGK